MNSMIDHRADSQLPRGNQMTAPHHKSVVETISAKMPLC